MLNQCILTGHLGNDPEQRFTQQGDSVSSFQFAFQSGKKTGWIKVTCFKNLADVVGVYLHKGAKITVIGRLDENQWTTRQNEKRSSLDLIANSIEFIHTDGRGLKNGQTMDDLPF